MNPPAEQAVPGPGTPRRRAAAWLFRAAGGEITRAARVWRDQPDDATLHACRIAVRRFRVLLRVFAADADPHGGRALRERLGRITDALGAARDGDIVAALAVEQHAGPEVMGALAASRRRAAASTARDLDARVWTSARRAVNRLVAALETAAASPRGKGARQTLQAYYRAETNRLVRRVLREAGAAESDDEETLHEFRIRLRRLRYLADLLAPHVRRPGRGRLRKVKAAEQALGAVHDVDLALAFIARRPRLPGAAALCTAWTEERRRRLDTFRAAWRICARRLAEDV